jgi:hypothetical protein
LNNSARNGASFAVVRPNLRFPGKFIGRGDRFSIRYDSPIIGHGGKLLLRFGKSVAPPNALRDNCNALQDPRSKPASIPRHPKVSASARLNQLFP